LFSLSTGHSSDIRVRGILAGEKKEIVRPRQVTKERRKHSHTHTHTNTGKTGINPHKLKVYCIVHS